MRRWERPRAASSSISCSLPESRPSSPPSTCSSTERGTARITFSPPLPWGPLAARGLSNRRISEALHISEATVKRHLANVYEKMGVGSRGEASQKALSEGWITAGDLTRDGAG